MDHLLRKELGELISEPLRNAKLIGESGLEMPRRDEAIRRGRFALAETGKSGGLARFREAVKKAESRQGGKKAVVFSSPKAVDFECVAERLGLPKVKS